MKSISTITFVFILAFLFSCKKNTASIPATGQVSFYASGVTNSPVLKVASSKQFFNVASIPKIKWRSATIFVNAISFEGASNQNVKSNKPVEANFDLFDSNNPVGKLDLPLGEYKDVKVMLDLKKSQNSERSFYLQAEFTDGLGVTHPVIIGCSDEFKVKLSVNTIKINPNKTYKAVIEYKLDQIFNGITAEDLLNTYRYEDGTIGIFSSVNPLLYEKVQANWQNIAAASFVEN